MAVGFSKTIQTSNKNFILKYFRCRDGKRTETRIGMEGICITHSCIPPLWAIMCCMYTVYSGMQEWVIQIPSIPILVSVLFPSLHLKYFRIKFLLLVKTNNVEWHDGTAWYHTYTCKGISSWLSPAITQQTAATVKLAHTQQTLLLLLQNGSCNLIIHGFSQTRNQNYTGADPE